MNFSNFVPDQLFITWSFTISMRFIFYYSIRLAKSSVSTSVTATAFGAAAAAAAAARNSAGGNRFVAVSHASIPDRIGLIITLLLHN